jgi:hypothetical protein
MALGAEMFAFVPPNIFLDYGLFDDRKVQWLLRLTDGDNENLMIRRHRGKLNRHS